MRGSAGTFNADGILLDWGGGRKEDTVSYVNHQQPFWLNIASISFIRKGMMVPLGGAAILIDPLIAESSLGGV